MSAATWWRSAVIYEVYPRSFADASSDGVGDLSGLRQRLDYVAALGVDGVWLTPIQRSPQVDQGYDISDYRDVDPLFGDLDELDALLAEAHARGLRVLLDIVPNHTSTQNPAFQAALDAGPGSPERDLFHFRDSPHGPNVPPNNWVSVFGGPAWHRANPGSTTDQQWYLHLFSPAQPDWNWDNPAVTEHFDQILRFWFDRSVDGMRIDVAHGLFKAPGLPDSPAVPTVIDGLRSNPLAMDQEAVHEVYRRWRKLAEEYDPPRLLVGEVNLEPDRAARYTRPDEMHQCFAFAFARLGWDAAAWVDAGHRLEQGRSESGAEPGWAVENHDLVRVVSRYGGGDRGVRRARAALVALLGLPGAVYLYQGQELGLPEVDVSLAKRADPMWASGGVSRDGARIPLPWTVSTSGAHGFTTDGVEPWLPVPEGWGELSVERQNGDPSSSLTLTRHALALRKELYGSGVLSAHDKGAWEHRPDGSVVCSRTSGVQVMVAMGDQPVALPDGELLLASAPLTTDGHLPPDTAAWVRSRD
ncbi:alpha-amylase family glycosyl hydrolase [Georgenia muralis]